MQDIKLGETTPDKEQELEGFLNGLQVGFDNVMLLSFYLRHAGFLSELLIAAHVAKQADITGLYEMSFNDAINPVERTWPIAITRLPPTHIVGPSH